MRRPVDFTLLTLELPENCVRFLEPMCIQLAFSNSICDIVVDAWLGDRAGVGKVLPESFRPRLRTPNTGDSKIVVRTIFHVYRDVHLPGFAMVNSFLQEIGFY